MTKGLCPFAGRCPAPQQGLRPCTPTKGLCPLETQSGALPPTPPQGPSALDPSPGNPKGFPGCFYLKQSYIFGLSLPVQLGGFPIAPWTPSVCILVSSICRNNENRFLNKHAKIPSSEGSPKVSKGRSESPLVAREGETPPCTKTYFQSKDPHTNNPPSLWAWGDGSRAK